MNDNRITARETQRVIKFRAWDNGIMKQFVRIPFYIGSDGTPYKDNDPHGVDMSGKRSISPLQNVVLMQFANETYSDGADVYEGDIYEYDYEYDSDYDGDMPIVKRTAGRGVVNHINDLSTIRMAKREGGKVKVIGDIYTTPHLVDPKMIER